MVRLVGVTNKRGRAWLPCFFLITLSLFFTAVDAFAAPDNAIVVRDGVTVGSYSTIQEAYNNCQDQDIIETQAITFNESPDFNLPIAVLLKGGYDPAFVSQIGKTTVQGKVTIRAGKITVDRLIIQTPLTYSISGTVTYNNIGLPGVSMSLTGTSSANVTTDSSGHYTFSGLTNGNYTITPSKPNYTFAPLNISQTVSGSNITGVNFTSFGPSYVILGSVWENNGGGPVQGVTLTLNTVPATIATTDSFGNYFMPNIPNGTFTLTPSLPGTNAIFYPANSLVTVNGSDVNVNFSVSIGHNISGFVNYSGLKSGQIYIGLYQNGNTTGHGTSISAPGAFTIRGVPAGTYTIAAIMDIFGYGTRNAADPSGVVLTITVTGGDLAGQNITLSDPSPATPITPNSPIVSPGSQSAVIIWNASYDVHNKEIATAYKIYWGTDANASNKTPITVPANGQQAYVQSSGLTNGVNFYYKISALVGATESAPSSVVGPITIGAGTGANTVSGTVTIPVATTGPLYVGVYSNSNGHVYFTKIAAPSSSQPYSVSGVPNGTYGAFAFVDMNNDGQPDIGDLTAGLNGDPSIMITVNNSNVIQNMAVSNANAVPEARTYHWTDGTNQGYGLNFDVYGIVKLPVKVALTSGPNVPVPIDMQRDDDNPGRFFTWVDTGAVRPSVGDTYGFSVTYSDNATTQTMPAAVTVVLDSFAQNLTVTPTPSNIIPTFSWSAPTSPPATYTYDISVSQNFGGQVWSYDGDIPSSQTSIQYNEDGSASQRSLTSGTQYNWQVTVRDANGNKATYSTTYTP